MILFKPQVELLVSTEQTLQRFADDVLVRRASEESRIALKHRVRFLVGASRNYLLFLLGFYLRNQGHLFISSAVTDSKLLCSLHATLPATERGILLDTLGGSDPRRRRRWAAAKPLKVGSLPPKIRFSPRSTPMLRRRSCSSVLATSTCGQWKSGRKSTRKAASGPLPVPEASFCVASNVLTRLSNILKYMADRSSTHRDLRRTIVATLRQISNSHF